MSIIKGDIRRALGYKTITISGIEFDLSKTKAKDIVSFQEMPLKAGKGKKPSELTTDDLLAANELSTKWFVDYFMVKEPETNQDDIEHFIVKNKRDFQKEFTIGFGLKSREDYDADEKEATEKLSKKD